LEKIMTNVVIVYHSGFGHTQALAEAVAKGAQAVPGTKVSLVPVAEAEAREAELDAADAVIFGSPTYMGGVSAELPSSGRTSSAGWRAMATSWPPASASASGTATSTTRFTSCSPWPAARHGVGRASPPPASITPKRRSGPQPLGASVNGAGQCRSGHQASPL
jgi:hypothetical protein